MRHKRDAFPPTGMRLRRSTNTQQNARRELQYRDTMGDARAGTWCWTFSAALPRIWSELRLLRCLSSDPISHFRPGPCWTRAQADCWDTSRTASKTRTNSPLGTASLLHSNPHHPGNISLPQPHRHSAPFSSAIYAGHFVRYCLVHVLAGHLASTQAYKLRAQISFSHSQNLAKGVWRVERTVLRSGRSQRARAALRVQGSRFVRYIAVVR